MLSFFAKNPRNILLTVSLITIIGGGVYHWWTISSLESTIEEQKEQLQEKNREIADLQVRLEKVRLSNERLKDSIDEQNDAVEKWKEEANSFKEKISEKQKEAQKIKQDLKTKIEKMEDNNLKQNATCDEAMNWMKKDAIDVLKGSQND